jgi:Anti-sigma-K factor rskA
MLSERDIEQAHPEAFDFVFGNLPPAEGAGFNRHLASCRYCRAVVDEYAEIGGIIKILPPHVEPPAELEERTVAAMVAALAGQRASADRRSDAENKASTRVYPVREIDHGAEPETLVQPRPQLGSAAGDDTTLRPAPGDPPARARPVVTRLPLWRRYRGRLAAAVAVAAAIIVAAIVVPLTLGRGQAEVTVVIPLHATTEAKDFGVGEATGQATARQAGESWTFDLTVHGLKPLHDNDVYVCWWVGPGSTKIHPLLVTGGSFIVGDSGSTTLTMTTGVDPRQFRTMEITAEQPGNGALSGAILLTGQPATA